MKWVFGGTTQVTGFYERAPLDQEFWTRLWRHTQYRDTWRYLVNKVVAEHSRMTRVELKVEEEEVTRGELWTVLRHLDLVECPFGRQTVKTFADPRGYRVQDELGVWVLKREMRSEDMAAAALAIIELHDRRHNEPGY